VDTTEDSKNEQRIVCTPLVCAGAPRLRETRLNVYNIISRVSMDGTAQEMLSDYPYISIEDSRAAIDYCMPRTCERDQPQHYCDGCVLRTKYDGITFEEFLGLEAPVQTTDSAVDRNRGGLTFLGSMDELRKHWEGEPGWEKAAKIRQLLIERGELPLDANSEEPKQ